MTVYIYGLYCPKSGALRYIGKALNVQVRFDLHLSESRCGRNSHKNQWLKGLLREDLFPEVRILETIENSNDQDWQERERWWIETARECGDPLTNLDGGGRGGYCKHQETKDAIRKSATGRKMSPEAIAKMKATKAARLTPEVRKRLADAQRGRVQSEETRLKRSASLKGRIVSPETRAKISASNKLSHPKKERTPKVPKIRQPITEETRLKMRLAKLGKKQTPEAIEASHAKLRGLKRSPEVRAKMSEAKRLGWARKKALQSVLNSEIETPFP